ncbi:site-specific integrase [Zwartia sp.]|uniref:tyrosine-type recombinase/integrase n=1 Tax=Zwartia sp. TaxID=2978004 RepID=UPI00271FE2AC|nr:site-specific integrase [Zwartia sp.]MDO9025295.1 site-specific integrase [Zwartia sp.]
MTINRHSKSVTPIHKSYARQMANLWSSCGESKTKHAKTLTKQDIELVLTYIEPRQHAPRNRALLMITYYSGMRVGEVAGLRYKDIVDVDRNIRAEILLLPEITNGAAERTVFISEKLRLELTHYLNVTEFRDPHDKFFYTQKKNSEGFTPNTLAQHFHYLYRRSGVVGATGHSGRRSFIKNLASKGVSVHVLADLAGHKSVATTRQYINKKEDVQRQAVELI